MAKVGGEAMAAEIQKVLPILLTGPDWHAVAATVYEAMERERVAN